MVERVSKDDERKRTRDTIPIPSSSEMAEALRKEGIAETIKTKEGVFDVVDTDALREYFFERFGNGGGRNEENTAELLQRLASMFPRGIVSKEQFEQGERTPEPLFYNPGPSEAVSTSTIKAARFHFRFKDVLGRFRIRTSIADGKSGLSKVSYVEADAALVIFHPRYGNGYRDEDDVLRVADDSGAYRPLTAEFLTQMGVHKNIFVFPEGAMRHSHAESERRSIREGVIAELPHLVAKGLIRPEKDFRQITLGNEKVNERQAVRGRVTSAGSCMINGVAHYIGKSFYGKSISIAEVSPSLGAVIDESGSEPRVTHVFNVLSREEADSREHGDGKTWYSASKNRTRTRGFSAESFGLPKLPEETKLAYEDRKEAIDKGIAFLLLKARDKFPAIAELFSGSNQNLLGDVARIAYWLGKEEGQTAFDKFYLAYGNPGLQSLLSTTVDQGALREVLLLAKWGEKHDFKSVQDVFKNFAELTDRIDTLDEYLRTTFDKEDPELAQEVTQKILVRARDALGRAHAAAEKDSLAEVLAEIAHTDANTRLFIDVCRSLRERGAFDPRRIAGSEYLTIHGGEFKGTFRHIAQEMLRIQETQYGPEGSRYSEENPELYQALNEALRTRIEHPEQASKFHVFMHEGRLVGFFRLDEQHEGGRLMRVHLASVMGDPFFKGGSLIERLIEQAILELTVPTHAECDPRSAITGKYLRMGFVAKEVAVEKGLTVFRIERNPEELSPEAERHIPVAKIHEHAKNESTDGPNVQYRSCASAKDIDNLLRTGWVLTHWEPKLNMKRETESFSARLRKIKT